MPLRAAADTLNYVARDWLTLAFTGLGISTAPHEYFGGLFLACAGASIIARNRNDPRKLWSVIGTAALSATIAAIYGAGIESAVVPPQIAMLLAGVGSGVAINLVIIILGRIEERSGEIADKAIDHFLPEDEGK